MRQLLRHPDAIASLFFFVIAAAIVTHAGR
jgi:hypothetical protein